MSSESNVRGPRKRFEFDDYDESYNTEDFAESSDDESILSDMDSDDDEVVGNKRGGEPVTALWPPKSRQDCVKAIEEHLHKRLDAYCKDNAKIRFISDLRNMQCHQKDHNLNKERLNKTMARFMLVFIMPMFPSDVEFLNQLRYFWYEEKDPATQELMHPHVPLDGLCPTMKEWNKPWEDCDRPERLSSARGKANEPKAMDGPTINFIFEVFGAKAKNIAERYKTNLENWRFDQGFYDKWLPVFNKCGVKFAPLHVIPFMIKHCKPGDLTVIAEPTNDKTTRYDTINSVEQKLVHYSTFSAYWCCLHKCNRGMSYYNVTCTKEDHLEPGDDATNKDHARWFHLLDWAAKVNDRYQYLEMQKRTKEAYNYRLAFVNKHKNVNKLRKSYQQARSRERQGLSPLASTVIVKKEAIDGRARLPVHVKQEKLEENEEKNKKKSGLKLVSGKRRRNSNV